MPEAISQLLAKLQPALEKTLATTRTHRWYWIGGGSAVVAAAAAAVVVFGGFLGPSGKQICTASLTMAKDYGVISPAAELASNSAKSTDVEKRRQCTAQVGEDKFNLLVDLKAEDNGHKKCRDPGKQAGCVVLYKVARSDGMTTYLVREIPPDETDEAIAAREGGPKLPSSNAASDAGGGFDTDTAVDNSGTTAPAPVPGPGAPQQ